ncbi:lipoprotein-releasing system transmembrane subunit LolC, partial [Salmonella enterica subsp. enterica serovar Infantis]|nr:lipoprotein-releasing system transmembrane subunit LolC [Salmonella enterica subsp. enterica serovar Infantis]
MSAFFRITLTNSYGSDIYAFRFRLYTRDFANSNQTDYMYQPVALFIGLRYMRGRAADRFGRFVSWLSTIGITLGVMALVTVLSVMNGFERELQNNILGLMPQAILSAEHGSLNPSQMPEKAVNLQGVNRIAP